jgi:hypothetical protein
MRRLRTTTPEAFAQLWRADGAPLVIEDGGRGRGFEGASCESIAAEWPDSLIKQEYSESNQEEEQEDEVGDDGHGGDEDGDDDDGRIRARLGNLTWMAARDPGADSGTRSGPSFAPFYFGIKDNETLNEIYVRRYPQMGYMLRHSATDVVAWHYSPEMWFSGVRGSGERNGRAAPLPTTRVCGVPSTRCRLRLISAQLTTPPPAPRSTVLLRRQCTRGHTLRVDDQPADCGC